MKNLRRSPSFWHLLLFLCILQSVFSMTFDVANYYKDNDPKLYAQLLQYQLSKRNTEQNIDYTPLAVASLAGGLAVLGGMAYNYYWHINNHKLQSVPTGGDFDRVLTASERFDFLDKQLVPRSADVNLHIIARLLDGWTQGRLEKYVAIVKSLALKNKNSFMSMDNLELARQHVTEGQSDRQNWINYLKDSAYYYFGGYEDLKASAIHEAAHIVALIYNDTLRNVYYVTLDRNSSRLYNANTYIVVQHDIDTEFDWDVYWPKLENFFMALCAGGVAVQIFGLDADYSTDMLTDKAAILKFCSRGGMSIDMQIIKEQIAGIYPNLSAQEQQNFFEEIVVKFYLRAYQFILEYKTQIQKVADLLIAKRNVWGDEIYTLLGVQRPKFDFEQGDIVKIA